VDLVGGQIKAMARITFTSPILLINRPIHAGIEDSPIGIKLMFTINWPRISCTDGKVEGEHHDALDWVKQFW